MFLVLSLLLFTACSKKEEIPNENTQDDISKEEVAKDIQEEDISDEIDSVKNNKDKQYILEDIKEFKEGYVGLLENDKVPEAIKLLDLNIEKLDKEKATEAVEALLYFLDVGLLEGSKNYFDLIVYGNKHKVEETDIDSFFKSTDDSEIKSLYENLIENNYMIKIDRDEQYIDELQLTTITIDNKKISNKYEKYIRKDLADLLKLREKEHISLYSLTDGMVSLDKTLSNILNMEEYLEKHKKSPYVYNLSKDLTYQYQAYFGYFDWSNIFDEDGKIEKEAKEYFETAMKEQSNAKVLEKIDAFLTTLESEGYKKTEKVENLIINISDEENTKE